MGFKDNVEHTLTQEEIKMVQKSDLGHMFGTEETLKKKMEQEMAKERHEENPVRQLQQNFGLGSMFGLLTLAGTPMFAWGSLREIGTGNGLWILKKEFIKKWPELRDVIEVTDPEAQKVWNNLYHSAKLKHKEDGTHLSWEYDQDSNVVRARMIDRAGNELAESSYLDDSEIIKRMQKLLDHSPDSYNDLSEIEKQAEGTDLAEKARKAFNLAALEDAMQYAKEEGTFDHLDKGKLDDWFPDKFFDHNRPETDDTNDYITFLDPNNGLKFVSNNNRIDAVLELMTKDTPGKRNVFAAWGGEGYYRCHTEDLSEIEEIMGAEVQVNDSIKDSDKYYFHEDWSQAQWAILFIIGSVYFCVVLLCIHAHCRAMKCFIWERCDRDLPTYTPEEAFYWLPCNGCCKGWGMVKDIAENVVDSVADSVANAKNASPKAR